VTGTEKGKDAEFEARTRALFDDSLEQLDGRTRSRLTQARHAALEELRAQRRNPWRRAWLPLGGATVAAVLAVWITVGQLGTATGPEGTALPLEDFDVVAEAPSLDLLEDVEFYTWIAREPIRGENNG
jgi:hypothetical protein